MEFWYYWLPSSVREKNPLFWPTIESFKENPELLYCGWKGFGSKKSGWSLVGDYWSKKEYTL